MRKSFLLWALGVVLLAVLATIVLLPANPALSQRVSTHLQLDRASLGVMSASQVDLPLNCSHWHEIWPTYCLDHHQDAYADNGDNEISVCDVVTLDGLLYHVDWVGMTYWVDIPGGYHVGFEPTATHNPLNPVCELWHVVESNYPLMPVCSVWHVEEWVNVDDTYVDDNDRLRFTLDSNSVWSTVVAEGISVTTTPTGGFNIPTLNEWGILILLLVLVGAGTLFIRRRYRTTNA